MRPPVLCEVLLAPTGLLVPEGLLVPMGLWAPESSLVPIGLLAPGCLLDPEGLLALESSFVGEMPLVLCEAPVP